MKREYDLQSPGFRVDNINIVNVSRDRGYKHFCKEGRPKHGFLYTVKGGVENRFLGVAATSFRSQAGELLFIPKDTSYTAEYLEDGTELKIIQFDLLFGELPSYLSAPAKIALPNAAALIESFFAPLSSKGVTNHPLYYLSRIYELLWQLENAHAHLPAKHRRLSPALREMQEHFAEDHPVSHYAALCDMSEVNFRRMFKEYTGLSPLEYRNGVRLERARALLSSTEFNVSEAAYATGFQNLSFFIRLYKKKYGYTPKNE